MVGATLLNASVYASSPELEFTPKPAVKSQLGLGFLISNSTQPLLPLLNTEQDFLEMVLGPAKVAHIQSSKPAKTMCVSMSVKGIADTISILKNAGIAPDDVYIAYSPERRSPRETAVTPDDELNDLIGSIKKIKPLLAEYKAPLIVGPGLSYMETHEYLYEEAALLSDIWMIQTQRLQVNPNGEHASVDQYRERVQHIVGLLRKGNPNIKVFVQIIPGILNEQMTEPITAEQVAAYLKSIEDLVDAAAIYGGKVDIITEVFKRLRG